MHGMSRLVTISLMPTERPQLAVLSASPTARSGAWWVGGSLIAILIGCTLRFWEIGRQGLWFDEGYTAWVMSLSPWRIVQVIRHDVSPPLYYLVLWGWTQWFGHSETALRSLSALAACLAIPLVGAGAWTMTQSRKACIVAMSVMALSAIQVQFAQEARSYGVASFLALLAFYAAMRAAVGRRRWLILMLAATVGFVHLHNMMWFYLAGLNAAYLLMPSPRSLAARLREMLALDVLTALCFAWWIPSLLGQMQWLRGNFWASTPGWVDLWRVLAAAGGMKLYHLSAILSHYGNVVAALILGPTITLALARRPVIQSRWAAALLIYAILPVVMVFAYAQMRQSFFVEKVFTASTFAIPLLAGLVCLSSRRWMAWCTLAALMGGSAISVWGYFHWESKEDWRSAVAAVNQLPRQGTLVVFVANEGQQLYDYYTNRSSAIPHEATGAPQAFLDLDPPRTIQRVLKESDLDKLRVRLDKAQPERVVLVLSHTDFSDPKLLTRNLIAGHYNLVKEEPFRLVSVAVYER